MPAAGPCLSDLPAEMQEAVLSAAHDWRDWVRCRRVCRLWRDLLEEREFWRKVSLMMMMILMMILMI